MASAGAQKTSIRAGTSRVVSGEANAEFPILCETCLGPNQFLRMIRSQFDKECKICCRPMTIFRWKPGKDSRYKTTIACQTCAKLKNVCQTCLFDLDFGLPVAVRDHFAGGDKVTRHQSEVQREYFMELQEKQLADGALTAYQTGATKAATNEDLQRLARTTPYYKRNRPHICSFFVKGECRRGKECPYRHEMPEGGELSEQNIKDRYYGTNDPVANKIFRLHREQREADEKHREALEAAVSDKKEADQYSALYDLASIPLPPGPPPMPASYYAPAPPVNPEAAPAYPSTGSNWMGERLTNTDS
eukprot:Sspe_Gene.9282::Locus_3120_Transcript_1_1_Confidence_1.000_Length_1027::g.9282::m.9282/K12872/RBM22, SLT11; pre-mRNA-splicing factor RBM22/SLT11